MTEFILFVTSEAFDNAEKAGRRTIQGQDILQALESLDFDDYHACVYWYNQKYQEANKQDLLYKQDKQD